MRFLVETLRLPSGSENNDSYVWPRAFIEPWDQVPQDKRDELGVLYGQEALNGWDEFGGFIGYRLSIAADGKWQYFVAGD